MSFNSLANKTHFHIKGFAFDLALKQRHNGNSEIAYTHPNLVHDNSINPKRPSYFKPTCVIFYTLLRRGVP